MTQIEPLEGFHNIASAMENSSPIPIDHSPNLTLYTYVLHIATFHVGQIVARNPCFWGSQTTPKYWAVASLTSSSIHLYPRPQLNKGLLLFKED